MLSKRRLVEAILILLSIQTFGQNISLEEEIRQFIESNQILLDNEANIDGRLELLYDRLKRPLDINKAKYSDWEELLILNPKQINDIIQYKENYGSFLSIYELQQVESLTKESLQSLRPFLTIKNKNKDQRPFVERLYNPDIHYLLIRNGLPRFSGMRELSSDLMRRGKENSSLLLKYKYQNLSDFSFGINMEKDVGEHIHFNRNRPYLLTDHKSLYFHLEDKGVFDQIIIGDYNLQFGQGLIFGSGFGFGKGGDPILSAKRNNLGILPHSSSLETGYLRGLAITSSNASHQATIFSSFLSANARIESSQIKSFHNSGYHRNENEISQRNSYFEGIGGLKYDYQMNSSRIGLMLAYSEFQYPYVPDSRTDNLFTKRNEQHINTGFDYEWNIASQSIFGEIAFDSQNRFSLVQGLLSSISKTTDISTLIRYYSPGYMGIRPMSFGEHQDAENEKGVYLGLKQKLGNRIIVSMYTDVFAFPWLKFQSNKIQNGNEFFLRTNYRFNRGSSFNFNLRSKKRLRDNKRIENRYLFDEKIRASLSLDHLVRKGISIRNGFQYVNANGDGFAMFGDLRLEHKRIRIDSRICYYNTGNFSRAVYLGEREVLYAFSAPALYGQGARSYILIKYKLSKKIQLWLKYSKNNRFVTIEEGKTPYEKNSEEKSLKIQLRIDLR